MFSFYFLLSGWEEVAQIKRRNSNWATARVKTILTSSPDEALYE